MTETVNSLMINELKAAVRSFMVTFLCREHLTETIQANGNK